MSAPREYLGDSVYATFEEGPRGGIVLTTENGGQPTNRIVLDFEVYTALMLFIEKLRHTEKP